MNRLNKIYISVGISLFIGFYVFTVWLKTDSVNTVGQINIKITSGGNSEIIQIDKFINSSNWTQITDIVNLTWNLTPSEVRVRLQSSDSEMNDFYLDDVYANYAEPISSINVTEQIRKKELSIHNYPNPFNPSTNTFNTLPNDSKVKLTIFNSLGEEIAVLLNNDLKAGQNNVLWNGCDGLNNEVSSGIYFAVLQTPLQTKLKTGFNKIGT
ncbi:MAG: T9SS type A sorting domain-containing protein [Melioribacteraceae bacterium]|nr:T9SS type A sorting domain-containing protein [Melioribacteraceae bacterium]